MAARKLCATSAALLAVGTAGLLPAAAGAAHPRLSRAPETTSTGGLDRTLASDLADAGGTSSALVVDTTTNQTLFAENATTPRLPASVEKLFTTSTALFDFGYNYRFQTDVYGVGTLRNGVFTGKLYLKGGGDPTFGDVSFNNANYGTGVGSSVQGLLKTLREDGVHQIKGEILGDATIFDDKGGGPATGYAPNLETEGDLSGLSYDDGFTSGSETALQPRPALWAAQAFASVAPSEGITLAKGTTVSTGVTPASAQLLARVYSPTLTELIKLTNTPSNDFFAETLNKDIGHFFGAGGTTAAGAYQVEKTVAAKLGLSERTNDGSGLSRYDRTTSTEVVELLEEMKPSVPFFNSLAVAGVSGTMQYEMLGTSAVNNCRGKTGTLHDVANLVGFCTAANGDLLAFAFLENGLGDSTYGHDTEDAMGEALAAYDGQGKGSPAPTPPIPNAGAAVTATGAIGAGTGTGTTSTVTSTTTTPTSTTTKTTTISSTTTTPAGGGAAADSRIAALSPEPERLDSLTGLRFFAALAVLLLHIINLLGPRIPLGYLWSYGSLGVTFFFALSGFVLTWTARPTEPPRRFWRKRVARVVPLYLAMLAVCELLLMILPLHSGQFPVNGSGAERSVIPVLSAGMLQAWIAPGTLAFLATSVSSPNPPGWSLSVEAFFYALFPALIPRLSRLRRRGLAVLVAVDFALMVAVYVIVRVIAPTNTAWLAYFPVFELGFFVAGMATARALADGVRFPPLGVALGAVGVLGVCLDLAASHHLSHATDLPLVELVAFPFTLLLLGSAASADLAGAPSPFRSRVLVTLGVWSFALYLVQIACFIVALWLWPHGLSPHRDLACLEAVAFIAAAIGVAGLAHHFIEAPANRRLRHDRPAIIDAGEVIRPAEG